MNKIDPNIIWKYYLSNDFVPELPSKTGFRHYRFKLPDGSWRKVPETVGNKEMLVKWIIKLGGVDLYYSTSQWLVPYKISSKGNSGTYHVAHNLLINNDLVFDFDAEEPVTIERLDYIRKCTNNVYEVMKSYKHRFKLDYASVTGYKGFRLAYTDTQLNLPGDPRKRLDYVTENRKVFIVELLNKLKTASSNAQIYKIETVFDQKITENIMCVIRLLGSVHSTTGIISTKIPVSDLRKPIKDILAHIPYVGKKRLVIPYKREMKGDDVRTLPRPRLEKKETDVPSLASLPISSSNIIYYFTNKVLGIKRGFVPVFIYHKSQKYYKKELKRLQEKYNLGAIYIFQSEDELVCLALKTMQKRQLQKVLTASTSKTKHSFKKYNRIWVPYSMTIMDTLPSSHTGHLSRGHMSYINPNANLRKEKFCGWEKIELIRARYEKNG